MGSLVNATPAAPSGAVLRHLGEKLALEVDCWEVHESLKAPEPDFVLMDVRGPAAFADGHVPGAVNIPYNNITATQIGLRSKGVVFVVYGAGPHCHSAEKAAIGLARLQLPVKIMAGGISGWLEEGFELEPMIGTLP